LLGKNLPPTHFFYAASQFHHLDGNSSLVRTEIKAQPEPFHD
jgi:hypothetical protein